MKRQWVISQIKEQDKTPEKQLNEMKLGNFSGKKKVIIIIKIMIVKVIHDLRKRMEKIQGIFTKELEKLKSNQTEMNNTLEGISSRITEAKEQISDLKGRMVEITATKQSIEKRVKHKQKNEDSLTDFCIKCTLTLYGVPEGEEREKESKKIFEERIAENFVNMVKEIVN